MFIRCYKWKYIDLHNLHQCGTIRQGCAQPGHGSQCRVSCSSKPPSWWAKVSRLNTVMLCHLHKLLRAHPCSTTASQSKRSRSTLSRWGWKQYSCLALPPPAHDISGFGSARRRTKYRLKLFQRFINLFPWFNKMSKVLCNISMLKVNFLHHCVNSNSTLRHAPSYRVVLQVMLGSFPTK